MKHYSLPAALLLCVSLLLLFLITRSFAWAGGAARELVAQRAQIQDARLHLAGVQREAQADRAKSRIVDSFLAAWTPQLADGANVDGIFGRLDTLAVDNLLSPSGKNYTQNTNYYFDGRHLTVEDVDITVAGDYYRTLNWLGAVEDGFPMARVEQISYTTNGNSLALRVELVFPRNFDHG